MRLPYSQETLGHGCREPAAPALLEHPREMPSAAPLLWFGRASFSFMATISGGRLNS